MYETRKFVEERYKLYFLSFFNFFFKKVWRFKNNKIFLQKINFNLIAFMYRLAITAVIAFICSILGTVTAQDHASNIRTRVSDEQLIIFYDLSERADVEVYASFDGGATFTGPLRYVVGAVGNDVLPENNKVVVWNGISELGDVDLHDAVIRIEATVEQPEVPEPPPIPQQFSSSGSSSEYKPFRVDLCLGMPIPLGGLFLVEPKFAVIPNLSIGLKIEAAMLAPDLYGPAKSEINAQLIVSPFLTLDYHIPTGGNIRPFIGAGGGLYMITAARADFGGTVAASSNNFGGMGRAGLEFSRFRLAVAYNFVAGEDGFGNKASYIGINLGAYLGGGRR